MILAGGGAAPDHDEENPGRLSVLSVAQTAPNGDDARPLRSVSRLV